MNPTSLRYELIPHHKRLALEIGAGFIGTTAAFLMRRAAAHRNDVDVQSCMANLYRLNRPNRSAWP